MFSYRMLEVMIMKEVFKNSIYSVYGLDGHAKN